MLQTRQGGPGFLGMATQVSAWELIEETYAAQEGRRPGILIIDPQAISRHVIRGMLHQRGYRLLEASTVAEAREALERDGVDLVIADLALPETSGLDFCRQIKADRRTYLIPVVLITSVQGASMHVAGLEAGADEFLVRPLNTSVVRTRVAALLRHKADVDSLEEAEPILFVLAQAIEQRDEAISGHCKRLDQITRALGTALNLSRAQLLALHRGAYLHDIGKVGVPDSILFKPGPLSPQEWDIMRQHPITGEAICRPVKSLALVLPIIRSHHERWNGTGYPDGLAGEDIPLLARILQIADIYDALTSPRPYKRAVPGPRALEILAQEAQRGWREPRLVGAFREVWETTLWPAQLTALAHVQPAAATSAPPDIVPVTVLK